MDEGGLGACVGWAGACASVRAPVEPCLRPLPRALALTGPLPSHPRPPSAPNQQELVSIMCPSTAANGNANGKRKALVVDYGA